MNVLLRPLSTSIGGKVVVAITGLLLVGFVLGHMAGNLLIFLGRDWINAYAHHLKSLGMLLWIIRGGLLAVFVVHLVTALRLTLANSAARPVAYVYEDTMQASWASRHMALTGLMLLVFIVYHLAHFTAGAVDTASAQFDGSTGKPAPVANKHYLDLTDALQTVNDVKTWVPDHGKPLRAIKHPGEEYRHDVYSMVVNGFRNPFASVAYLVAMAVLGLHLWHGASSMLQTLGLNSRPWGKTVSVVGPAIADRKSVLGEQRDERIEVADLGGRQERGGHLPRRRVCGSEARSLLADAKARPRRDLAAGRRGLVDHGGDLAER